MGNVINHMFVTQAEDDPTIPIQLEPIKTILVLPPRPSPPASVYKQYFIKPQSKILCKKENILLTCFKYSIVNDRHFFRSNIRKNDKYHIITTIADDEDTLVNAIDKNIIKVIEKCRKQMNNKDFLGCTLQSFNYELIFGLLDKLNKDEEKPDKLKYFVVKKTI
jgi:hypothetical protein